MAQIDLQFLGEQMRQMQSDLRQVRSDQLRMQSEQVQAQDRLSRLETNLEVFREMAADRFDRVHGRFQQTIELIRAGIRSLQDEIKALKHG